MKKDLNNPADAKSIQEILKRGQSAEFWHIIKQVIDKNIDRLSLEESSEDINKLPAEEYKSTMQVIKAELNHWEYLKDLPESIIVSLDEPDQTVPKTDPYSTAKEIEEDSV